MASRRQFLAGLGIGAAGLLLPGKAFARGIRRRHSCQPCQPKCCEVFLANLWACAKVDYGLVNGQHYYGCVCCNGSATQGFCNQYTDFPYSVCPNGTCLSCDINCNIPRGGLGPAFIVPSTQYLTFPAKNKNTDTNVALVGLGRYVTEGDIPAGATRKFVLQDNASGRAYIVWEMEPNLNPNLYPDQYTLRVGQETDPTTLSGTLSTFPAAPPMDYAYHTWIRKVGDNNWYSALRVQS